MGLGDNLIASGMARGAQAKGRRIAFGDGKKILWDHNSPIIFKNNPNIAVPGSEGAKDLYWIPFYKGSRLYNHHDKANECWSWNYNFKSTPGEVFLDQEELKWAERFGKDYIVLEKNVPNKIGVINKDWSRARYNELEKRLKFSGQQIVELEGKAPSFRHALAALSRASLYVGPEGGLHHGAAAVGIPAVVIFGSWIPPQVTGYDSHKNMTGGADRFCGSLKPCDHCKNHLDKISVEEVFNSAMAMI